MNLYCCVCGNKLRQPKELHYLGLVCSKCFRMSKERYVELVDIMSKLKINFILEECSKIKKNINND